MPTLIADLIITAAMSGLVIGFLWTARELLRQKGR